MDTRAFCSGSYRETNGQNTTVYISGVVSASTGATSGLFFLTNYSRTLRGTIDDVQLMFDPVRHVPIGASLHANVTTFDGSRQDAYITLRYNTSYRLTYSILLHTLRQDGSEATETLQPGGGWNSIGQLIGTAPTVAPIPAAA